MKGPIVVIYAWMSAAIFVLLLAGQVISPTNATIVADADIGVAALRAAQSVVRIDVLRKTTGRPGKTDQLIIVTASGFVIDDAGHIATAAHVLEDAVEISIVTRDGRRLPALVRGRNVLTDIAVIAVNGPLPRPLEIAPSEPRVLSEMAAIGSPLGLDGSLSFGRIIASNRAPKPTDPAIFLQHDAAINPGSSGGPIIDRAGRVVGMNLSLPVGQFNFSGIAFAIGVRSLSRVTADLIETGSPPESSLGLWLRDLSDYAMIHGIGSTALGILVVEVDPDSVAARCGISPGDRIVSFRDKPVSTLAQLLRLLDTYSGETVRLGIVGDTGEFDTLVLTPVTAESLEREPQAKAQQSHGLTFVKDDGIRIATVRAGSLADAADLRPGDQVISMNLKHVVDPLSALHIADAVERLSLLIVRGGDAPKLVTLGIDPLLEGFIGANSLGNYTTRR